MQVSVLVAHITPLMSLEMANIHENHLSMRKPLKHCTSSLAAKEIPPNYAHRAPRAPQS